MHFYFIGIKGTGMSALANILSDLGYNVSGVDYNKKYFTDATLRKSINIETFENCILSNEYFYIVGNAFKISEITTKIKDSNYKYQYYSEFIEEFFKMPKIGVCGSHGKTTTTSFASQLIGEKINYLVGDGTGAGDVNSKYFLFEACEYQNNFLKYNYEYLIILNIDYDHPDFFKNSSEYSFAFVKAALQSNVVIVNYDDLNCRKIVHKNKITFGFNPLADIVLRLTENKLIIKMDEVSHELEFNFHGKHMAYNLGAAFIISYLIDKNHENIIKRVQKLKLP